MRPIKDIFLGDVYKLFTGGEYCVLGIDKSEKMIQVASMSLPEHLNKPFWKKNTDRMFNNRVMKGWSSRLHSDNKDCAVTQSEIATPKCLNKLLDSGDFFVNYVKEHQNSDLYKKLFKHFVQS